MELPLITGYTQLTALLGSPVAHSISPLMHNEGFRHLGLDYVYLCFDVNEAALPAAVNGLKAVGIRGFNLTMPNKNKIIDLLDQLSPAAELIGAVNTVINDNGVLTGHNTDGIGFIRGLQESGGSINGQTVTLMGAGGAGTAIAAQIALDGAREIHIFSRHGSRFQDRTEALADRINRTSSCQVQLYEYQDTAALRRSIAASTLLINATSVGMHPDTELSLIEDTTMFHENLFVSDIIYNPRETRLLQLARESGRPTLNGMNMLLYQGAEAFLLFTGQELPVAQVREKCFSGKF